MGYSQCKSVTLPSAGNNLTFLRGFEPRNLDTRLADGDKTSWRKVHESLVAGADCGL